MKNSQFTQADKDRIFDQCKEREFCIKAGQKRYPAQIASRLCDYPAVWARREDGTTLDIEINWGIAARIAAGEANTINA